MNGLTVLGKDMFFMNGGPTQLMSITIPSTIFIIGKLEHHYKYRSTLLHIYLLLGDETFGLCSSITEIVLTNGLTVIGNYMFDMFAAATLLTSISIPSSVTFFGKWSLKIIYS